MREHIHTAAVRFRVSETLLSAAQAKARAEGVSLGELVRHAIRKELRDAA